MNVIIYTTRDYDKFKPLKGNRGNDQIFQKHLISLEKSILEKNLLDIRPVVVNENNEIIDGHHRWEVARRNNLELLIICKHGLTFEDAIRLTSGTSDWTLQQYVDGYAKNDRVDYQRLSKFNEKAGISLSLFNALSNTAFRSKKVSTRIKKGEFKFEEEFEGISDVVDKCKEFTTFMIKAGRRKDHMAANYLWIALKKFIAIPGMNWQWFMQSVKKYHCDIAKRPEEKYYLQDFITVYNKDIVEDDQGKKKKGKNDPFKDVKIIDINLHVH